MTIEQKIITELSLRAAKGAKEKSYLLNEIDGVILDEQEADDATPYEVDFLKIRCAKPNEKVAL